MDFLKSYDSIHVHLLKKKNKTVQTFPVIGFKTPELTYIVCLVLEFLFFFFSQNKAIVTINAKTSEILTANDMAAELFSYYRQQLIGIKMSDLFADTHKEKQEALVEQHIETSGAVVMVNGKVVSLLMT